MDFNFGNPHAIAYISSGEAATGPTGTVTFYKIGSSTLVVAAINWLPHNDVPYVSGVFGFHIHEGTSCAGADFSDSKGHFNPKNCKHPYHAGDLPPLLECNGRAFMAVLTDRFKIPDVIGRTVIIHSHPDDFTSQPSGNAGTKIACGVIQPV